VKRGSHQRRRRSGLFAFILVVAASLAVSGLSAAQITSAKSGNAQPVSKGANLWIDVTGGACVRSARKVAYNNARACSWADANARCRGGDTVRVKGGDYGDVTIRGSNGRTSYCSLATLAREPVTARVVDLGIYQTCQSGPMSTSTTNWFKLTGPLKMARFDADCSDHVYLDKVDVDMSGAPRRTCSGDSGRTYACTSQPFHVGAGNNPGDIASNFTLRNSKVHDALNPGAMMWLGTPGTNFVLDHNEIYNLINNTNGDIHDECVRMSDLSHVRFTRNHLWGCFVMDVFVTDGSLFDAVFENNVFEAPTGSVGNSANAIFFARPPDTVTIRYNTFGSTGVTIPDPSTYPIGGGLTVVGNYFDTNPPCGAPNTTYAYNVTPRGVPNCGGPGARSFNASTLHSGFMRYFPYSRNGGASAQQRGDYRLRRGSPLINRGNRAVYPPRDRGGAKRFRGRAPDVGAYESPY
jgi:hypothetical protein